MFQYAVRLTASGMHGQGWNVANVQSCTLNALVYVEVKR